MVYDYFTQEQFAGNRETTVTKSLFEFPLFIKAGSIIPIAPYTEYSGAALDTLILLVYTPPKRSHNSFSLYEDDGESYAYQQGEYRWIKFDYEYEPGRYQKIMIHKPDGSFKGETSERAYRISVINTSKPRIITIDGERIDEGNTSHEYWLWDGGRKVVTIILRKRKISPPLKIEGEM